MGIINKITKRCVFCKTKGGCEYIPAFGIYNQTVAGNWYHEDCLVDISCCPKKYTHREVDMAIDIVDRIKVMEEKKIRERERRKMFSKKNCSYLKQYYSQGGENGKNN